jgi:ATP-binding cassette, subfamily F, member 3
MIHIDNASLAPGGVDLLDGATWEIRATDKVGLIGRNGTGKTSLMRAIVGELDFDTGQLRIRPGLQIGYLPQQAVSGSTATVWEEVQMDMHAFHQMRNELLVSEQAVKEDKPGAAARLETATETFRIAGGFAIESKIGGVLHGLGFQSETWHQPCAQFSGGWQMRIALARVLLAEPDLAILDEPTNHLDILARTWLARFLEQAPFACIIVSHDRHLLDKTCNRIVEIRGMELHHYTGNYTRFLAERTLRMEQHSAAFEKQQAEIAHLEQFITRFGAKATKAKQAQARKKQLARMDKISAPQRQSRAPHLRLAEVPGCAQVTLELRDATLGWTPDKPILNQVNLALEKGMRLGILGTNGCGKTTLLHSLWGRLPLLSGRRRPGEKVRIGVFTQDLAADLPPEATALQWVADQAVTIPTERVRAILGALGLTGDAGTRLIGALSGGERARVALAAIAAKPYNVLLLDEPTNHLDTETVDALIQGLKDYEGTLVLVSHDRHLIESLASHILLVQDGELHLHEGVSPSDFELQPAKTVKQKDQSGKISFEERKRIQRQRERAARRIGEIETRLETADEEVAALNDMLCDIGADYEKARELSEQIQQIEREVEQLYAEWETLEGASEGES